MRVPTDGSSSPGPDPGASPSPSSALRARHGTDLHAAVSSSHGGGSRGSVASDRRSAGAVRPLPAAGRGGVGEADDERNGLGGKGQAKEANDAEVSSKKKIFSIKTISFHVRRGRSRILARPTLLPIPSPSPSAAAAAPLPLIGFGGHSSSGAVINVGGTSTTVNR